MDDTKQGLGALAAALAKAQGAFPAIERTRTVKVTTEKGDKYTFDYATLDDVIAATRPALAANGLAVTQLLIGDEVVTQLIHAEGGWLESRLKVSVPADVKEAKRIQALGSAITYLRRYALQAILGVSAEYDDDGNTADGNTVEPVKRAPCPNCGKVGTVIAPRTEGDAWFCFPRKGGCGARFKFDPTAEPTPEDAKRKARLGRGNSAPVQALAQTDSPTPAAKAPVPQAPPAAGPAVAGVGVSFEDALTAGDLHVALDRATTRMHLARVSAAIAERWPNPGDRPERDQWTEPYKAARARVEAAREATR